MEGVSSSSNVHINAVKQPQRFSNMGRPLFKVLEKLIKNNMEGNKNEEIIGQYDEGILMMMYDSVVIVKEKDLI